MTLEAAKDLVKLMTSRSVTLAVCESLTGGALGAAITEVPGASAMFRGGLITYAADLKSRLAGVDAALVDQEGVVNELTALQMAHGTRKRCDSDWAVALTGVAGPTPLDGEDPGSVWFAVVGPRVGMSTQPRYTEHKAFEGERAHIRQASVEHALAMMLRVL